LINPKINLYSHPNSLARALISKMDTETYNLILDQKEGLEWAVKFIRRITITLFGILVFIMIIVMVEG